jgi:hypothetical protein
MANSRIQIISELQEQARGWVVLGISVVIFYPVIFFNWDIIQRFNLLLPLGLVGISGTMIWWFWTMRIVFKLLSLRSEDTLRFDEILTELKTIRKELQKEYRDIEIK